MTNLQEFIDTLKEVDNLDLFVRKGNSFLALTIHASFVNYSEHLGPKTLDHLLSR